MKKSISILLCYFNSEKFIYRALESLLNQGDVFIELILVDNNSTDRSAEIVSRFVNEEIYYNKIELFSVKVVKESQQGLAFARNRGFNLVTSDYVYILDSDNQLVDGILPIVIDQLSRLKADCFFLKNIGLSGNKFSYGDNFDKYWNIYDFFSPNSELTPIFSKNFIDKNKYFEMKGVTSELPILLYLKLFKYDYSLYAINVYGQIYDDFDGDHPRISTASIFTGRSYAGLVQRFETLKEYNNILPFRVKLKFFFEYNVFFILCLYLGYKTEKFTLGKFYLLLSRIFN